MTYTTTAYAIGAVVALIIGVLDPSLVAAMNLCGWVGGTFLSITLTEQTQLCDYLSRRLAEETVDD